MNILQQHLTVQPKNHPEWKQPLLFLSKGVFWACNLERKDDTFCKCQKWSRGFLSKVHQMSLVPIEDPAGGLCLYKL
jgi:hypothetical protein